MVFLRRIDWKQCCAVPGQSTPHYVPCRRCVHGCVPLSVRYHHFGTFRRQRGQHRQHVPCCSLGLHLVPGEAPGGAAPTHHSATPHHPLYFQLMMTHPPLLHVSNFPTILLLIPQYKGYVPLYKGYEDMPHAHLASPHMVGSSIRTNVQTGTIRSPFDSCSYVFTSCIGMVLSCDPPLAPLYAVTNFLAVQNHRQNISRFIMLSLCR